LYFFVRDGTGKIEPADQIREFLTLAEKVLVKEEPTTIKREKRKKSPQNGKEFHKKTPPRGEKKIS
jgi:hypothetical protein